MPEIKRGEAAGRGGVVEWEGCERVFAPVFKEEDYSPESLAVRFKDYASSGTEVSCCFSLGWRESFVVDDEGNSREEEDKC